MIGHLITSAKRDTSVAKNATPVLGRNCYQRKNNTHIREVDCQSAKNRKGEKREATLIMRFNREDSSVYRVKGVEGKKAKDITTITQNRLKFAGFVNDAMKTNIN